VWQTKHNTLLFIHFWHAPLGLHGAKHRHQSTVWITLSHVNCFIQGEVIGFQVLLDSLHPHGTRASWWYLPVLQGEAVGGGIFLASISSGICTMSPNMEKYHAWTIAERCGCLVVFSYITHHSATGRTRGKNRREPYTNDNAGGTLLSLHVY